MIIGSSKCGKIRYNRRMLSYWKIIKLIVGSGKCGKKTVTIVVLQFIGNVSGWLLKAANKERNRYNLRIPELLEIN